MSQSKLHLVEEAAFVVITAPEYFNEDAARALNELVDDCLPRGKHAVVVDFSRCELLNSPGVAGILDIMLKVVEDYQGKLIFCAANQLLLDVFELANILDSVTTAPDLESARKQALS